jgi:serine phosphatase RsbU (regulator of sigma subunit)
LDRWDAPVQPWATRASPPVCCEHLGALLDSTGLVGTLDVADASGIERFLAAASRLAGVRIYVASISGRIFSAAGAPAPSDADQARVEGLMLALCRDYEQDAAGTDADGTAYAARVITTRGLQIGAVIALGSAPAEVMASALAVATDFIDHWTTSEYELESLSSELLERYEEINLLCEISEALAAVYQVERICQIALEKGLGATGARAAVVMLEDESGERLEVAAAEGADGARLAGGRLRTSADFVQRVYASGLGLLYGELSDFPDVRLATAAGEWPLFADPPVLAVPIRAGDRPYGVIAVSGTELGDPFTAGELKTLVSIASQMSVAVQNSRLLESAKQNERVKRELELAEAIQSRLLPSAPPATLGLEIAGNAMHPATVGGDYYDYIAAAGDFVTFVMADVTGHSFGAALGMAMARTVLRGEIATGSDPAQTLAAAGRVLYQDLSNSDLMITIFLAQWNGTTKTLSYANAGHNPGLLWRAATGAVEALDADGIIVGVLELADYALARTSFEKGDVFLLYTDGIVEARNEAGDMFGDERLRALFARNAGRSAQEILDAIFDAVRAFIGSGELHDDVSAIVARVTS